MSGEDLAAERFGKLATQAAVASGEGLCLAVVLAEACRAVPLRHNKQQLAVVVSQERRRAGGEACLGWRRRDTRQLEKQQGQHEDEGLVDLPGGHGKPAMALCGEERSVQLELSVEGQHST